ncbi:MAG: (d)CMP kinase, partial [Aliidongia sp.]
VCPRAPLKLYITASDDARAVRRHKELAARGEAPSLEAVLTDLQARDARDSSRASAPMKPAADAILLDTTTLDADAVFAQIAPLVEALFAPSAARPG